MPRLNHNLSHSNANNNQQQTNLLTKIEENTKNIKLEAETIDINVADLEALQTTANTTLAAILVDTDAADSSLNTIEAQSVLTASRLNNIQNKISANVDGTGDTLGQINSNILLKNTQIETLLTAANVDHAANEVLLTNAEAHLGNIDTGIDVLEACVGSNKVNVNISSGSMSLASGASTEAKQDVMETSLNAIQSAVEGTLTVGSHAVTNAGTFAVQAACSGTVTANLSATDNAVLDSIVSKNTEIETLLTAANVDHAANEVLLTNAEAHLGNIDTGIDVLEACVGSNKVNVNISSGSMSLASGASTEAKQDVMETSLNAIVSKNTEIETLLTAANVDHAANEVLLTNAEAHLGNIDTGIDVLEACVGSNKVNVNISSGSVSLPSGASSEAKQDVMETSLNAIVSKNTEIETLLTAANVDHAANEALLITIDADTNDIKTNTAACATDLAALEVLSTAANVDLAAIEVLLTTIETTNTIKDVEWLSGATISDQQLSDSLDTEGFQNIFLYGENGASISGNSLRVFGSNTSAGTYYSVGTLSVVTSDSGRYLIREDSPLHDGPNPRYLKVFNASGTTQTITKLRAVMSHKLRYV